MNETARLGYAWVSAAAALLLFPASSAGAVKAPVQRTYTVLINKMAFAGVPNGLRAGDVIMWVNKDIFRHTATARDKSFDVDLPPGKAGRTVIKKAGLVSFFCRYHPGMRGQMKVAAK